MAPVILAGAAVAILVAWFVWQSTERGTVFRGAVLGLTLSFCYWYFLPAVNVFLIGFETDQIEAGPAFVRQAFLIAVAYMSAALLGLLVMFSSFRVPTLGDSTQQASMYLPPVRRLQRQAFVTVLSALGLLASRFGTDGTELILQIVTGETSARANMEYYNVSSGILSSLDGLWEIINIASCTFLLCLCTTLRQSLGMTRNLAVLALLVMFVASGSRSMIVYALVAGLLARSMRPPPTDSVAAGGKRGRWAPLAATVLLAAAAAAIASFGSRFENYEFGMASAVLGMLFNHNDMLRELASVLSSLDQYRHAPFFDFALTPFTFLLPRFLGFDKDIPDHLVRYNLDRMGIDIRVDPGNYFPGLVADFLMVFGTWGGVIAFAAFACAVTVATAWLGRAVSHRVPATALAASTLGLLFVSFRNIPGSFALSALIFAAFAILAAPKRTASNASLENTNGSF